MKIFYSQNNKKKFHKKGGFTLIEMIIAVFIFTISLSALMTVSARGLRAARLAQNQVIGDYLALEALEGVRNIRDAELLNRNPTRTWEDLFDNNDCWTDHVDGSSADGCGLIYDSSPVRVDLFPCPIGSSSECNMFYNDSTYRYLQFEGGSASAGYEDYNFNRKIQFTTLPGNSDELIVTVVVTWDQGKGRVEYTENLFLWI